VIGRNLGILLACQLISVSGTVLIVTIGGIVGVALASDPDLATLPLSVMVIGTASATVLAAMVMARVGRRIGFVGGALAAAAGAFIAAHALHIESFALFCVGVGLVGMNNAFVQQYRFAAAESVAPAHVGSAVSLILLGAIGGAFFGPMLATETHLWVDAPAYVGAMLALGVLQLIAAALLAGVRDLAVKTGTRETAKQRPLRVIVAQPAFVIAVAGGVVGYGAMTLIMTATPLSMHVGHSFSLEDTAWVIRSHVIAMYAPSLISGILISRIGVTRLMGLGVLAIAATLGVGLQGHEMTHYWWALVLLGVGWNFLYVGGTALLMETYRPAERFKAQAVNEFSVFGSSAAASLLAGSMINTFGWATLLWSAAPALLFMLLGLAWRWERNPDRRRP